MVSETPEMNNRDYSLNGTERRRGSAPKNLTLDLIQLAELQFELLRSDLTTATKTIRAALYMVVVAAAIMIAAAPVLLLAVAAILRNELQWSPAASLGLAGGVAIALSLLLLLVAWFVGLRGGRAFSRSVEELRSNVEWLKDALSSSSRPDAHSDSPTPRPK